MRKNISIGKFEAKGPFRRPRHRWENYIKINHKRKFLGVDRT
jgi:hypothetical protein